MPGCVEVLSGYSEDRKVGIILEMRRVLFAVLALTLVLVGLVAVQPPALADNLGLGDLASAVATKDVIIIFSSGGWGTTSAEQADDFSPVLSGIQSTLKQWGLDSMVVSYSRTRDGVLGRMTGLKEMVSSYKVTSQSLASLVSQIEVKYPDKRIILTGLSNGGAFVEETMKRLQSSPNVCALVAGVPFWHHDQKLVNILELNNGGTDSLSQGRVGQVLLAVAQTPIRWIVARISDQTLSLARALEVPGHSYRWSTESVGPVVVDFLRTQLGSPKLAID